MNDAVFEAALIEQFELRADVVRQGAFARIDELAYLLVRSAVSRFQPR